MSNDIEVKAMKIAKMITMGKMKTLVILMMMIRQGFAVAVCCNCEQMSRALRVS